MGGHGSGRYGTYSTYTKKTTVESCRVLDINWMIREGYFDGDQRQSGTIHWRGMFQSEARIGYEINVQGRWLRLHYCLTGTGESCDYKVTLTTTGLP